MSSPCGSCNDLSASGHKDTDTSSGKAKLTIRITSTDLRAECSLCSLIENMATYFMPILRAPVTRFWLLVDLEDGCPTNVEVGAPDKKDNSTFVAIGLFTIYLAEGTICSELPRLGSLSAFSSTAASERCFKFLKRKLDICRETHEHCSGPTETQLPARLVFIQDMNNLKLVEPGAKNVKYMALSHCWGTHQPITATSKNIKTMQQHILWDDLSPVFRDAVKICCYFGIKYLWIDSLCIVQDSKEDWEVESSKMCAYYENAYVTISAASSPNGTVSFLSERDVEWLPQEFWLGNTKIFARRHAGSSSLNQIEDAGPLATRAWVWQETVLSTRLFHFTPSELIWECKTHVENEQGALPRALYSMRLSQALSRCAKDPYNGWHELVSSYSIRDLTYESDRLPALSGVASKLHSLTGSAYLAGLWQKNLGLDLCWLVDWSGLQDSALPMGSTEYIAPSWAWPSVRGPISFTDEDPDSEFRQVSQVKHVECSVPGLNPYGKITGGLLILRGPVSNIRITCADPLDRWGYTIGEDEAEREPVAVDCALVANNGKLRRATKNDTLSSFSLSAPCILLGSQDGADPFFYAMVLGEVASDAFTRIGLVTLDHGDWFASAIEQVVRIL